MDGIALCAPLHHALGVSAIHSIVHDPTLLYALSGIHERVLLARCLSRRPIPFIALGVVSNFCSKLLPIWLGHNAPANDA